MSCDFTYGMPPTGSWNLVHIAALIPESHSLFAVPPGCARIIMLSALEAGLQGRFSVLNVRDTDVSGNALEEKILAAAAEVIREKHPKALLLFTSCIADFIGFDRDAVFAALRAEFPGVAVLDTRMNPINKNGREPPIVRMQKAILSLLRGDGPAPADAGRGTVNYIGNFLPADADHELTEYLAQNGFCVLQTASCGSFDALAGMGRSRLNVVLHPSAVPGAMELKARLGIPWVAGYRAACLAEAPAVYREITDLLGLPPMDTAGAEQRLQKAAAAAREQLGERTVRVDDSYHANTAAVAAECFRRGIPLRLYFSGAGPAGLDAARADDRLIREQVRVVDLEQSSIPLAHDRGTFRDPEAVCLGENAAYLSHSRYCVPGLLFSGQFGWQGIAHACRDIRSALDSPRDLAALPRTGWGCMSV